MGTRLRPSLAPPLSQAHSASTPSALVVEAAARAKLGKLGAQLPAPTATPALLAAPEALLAAARVGMTQALAAALGELPAWARRVRKRVQQGADVEVWLLLQLQPGWEEAAVVLQ